MAWASAAVHSDRGVAQVPCFGRPVRAEAVPRQNSVRAVIVGLPCAPGHGPATMSRLISIVLRTVVSAFGSRRELARENLALR
jgi:hypothetical protein